MFGLVIVRYNIRPISRVYELGSDKGCLEDLCNLKFCSSGSCRGLQPRVLESERISKVYLRWDKCIPLEDFATSKPKK